MTTPEAVKRKNKGWKNGLVPIGQLTSRMAPLNFANNQKSQFFE